jgi:SAM-dependent methyltransferase
MIGKIKTKLKKLFFLDETVEMLQQDIARFRDEYAESLYKLEVQRQDFVKLTMHTRWLVTHSKTASVRVDPDTVEVQDFDEYLRRFKSLHPHLYERWEAINLGTAVENYRKQPESSCSISSHEVALLFGGFIAPYLRGRVLDIGCGPYSVPKYLEGFPHFLLSGIDPLAPFEPHPFEFVQGFAEFLPWSNSTFDVVVAATSLDHILSLDLARSEITRVLKPGGVFLVWEGFIKGSSAYEPSNPNLELADEFHLFHFDEEWFEAYWSEYHVLEKINVNGTSFFYAMQKALGQKKQEA